MPAWLASIVTSIFKAGIEYLKLWYDQGKAAEHEWNAKTREAQLQAFKDAKKMELEIKEAKPIEVSSPSSWNAGALMLLLCVLAFSNGCALFTKYVHVPSKLPYIEAPARPRVPARPAFTPREVTLKDYALELEAKVKAYNALAKRENIKNGYEDVVSP